MHHRKNTVAEADELVNRVVGNVEENARKVIRIENTTRQLAEKVAGLTEGFQNIQKKQAELDAELRKVPEKSSCPCNCVVL